MNLNTSKIIKLSSFLVSTEIPRDKWVEYILTETTKKMLTNRYFEAIHPLKHTVMFVCSGDSVLDVCKQEHNPIFGEITEEEFNSYGDNPWDAPISVRRYYPKIVSRVKLTPI